MPKSIFTNEEIEFIKENYQSMDTREIAEILGKTRNQIKGKADGLKLKKGIVVNKFRDDEVEYLKLNYNVIETSEIAKNLKRTVKQINDKAYNMGLMREMVRYEYDDSFFEVIDTEEKAYWLGFIIADGCISQIFNNKTGALKSRTMEISLAKKDEGHLHKFLNSIKSNKPIESKVVVLKDIRYPVSKVSINNKKICNDLITLGCTPKKSLTVEFPTQDKVPNELIKHFVRGYFDGDGCISYNHENQTYIVSFVGTMDVITGIQSIASNYGLSANSIVKKGNAYQTSWGGFGNLRNWFSFLYEDATIFLDRKKVKFEEAISSKEYQRDVAYYHRNVMV